MARAGKLWGKPASGTAAKYLLTGLARCGVCGGGLTVVSRSHGRKRSFRYICSSNHHRGASICNNKLELPLDETNALILDLLEEDVLCEEVVDVVLDGVVDQITVDSQDTALRAALQSELAQADVELQRLTAAIVAGANVETVVQALRDRQARRDDLARELARLDGLQDIARLDRDVLAEKAYAKLADWRGVLGRQVVRTRQLLTKLLAAKERILFTPTTDDKGKPACQVVARFTFERFFEGILLPQTMASPRGSDATPCYTFPWRDFPTSN